MATDNETAINLLINSGSCSSCLHGKWEYRRLIYEIRCQEKSWGEGKTSLVLFAWLTQHIKGSCCLNKVRSSCLARDLQEPRVRLRGPEDVWPPLLFYSFEEDFQSLIGGAISGPTCHRRMFLNVFNCPVILPLCGFEPWIVQKNSQRPLADYFPAFPPFLLEETLAGRTYAGNTLQTVCVFSVVKLRYSAVI